MKSRKTTRIFLISFLFVASLISNPLFAQNLSLKKENEFNQRNKLFEIEQNLINKGFNTSSIGMYIMADSLSHNNDSIGASIALLKVNPLHLIAFWELQDINPIIENLNYLNLTYSSLKQYRLLLSSALKKPKSNSYKNFKKMLYEDQSQRASLDTCRDSIRMYLLHRQLIKGDSQRANYLYKYILKNGWPNIVDGGLFAGIIAIHDHQRHHFYLPRLRQSLIKGEGDIEAYRMMKIWVSSESLIEMQNILDNSIKETFDISSLLYNRMPDSLNEIINSIQKLCPVKLYINLETKSANNSQPSNIFFELKRRRFIEGGEHIITQFQKQIYTACINDIIPDMWTVREIPSQSEKEILLLHIVAKNSIGAYHKIKRPIEDLFDDLTQSIPEAHIQKEGDSIRVFFAELATFDLNKAIIKKSAYNNFEHFAYILNRYGDMKFYVDGHTDNTGNKDSNITLSIQRAINSKLLLQQNGVDEARIIIRGFGNSKPTQTNNNEVGRQANRRVEFVIYRYLNTEK